MPVPPASAAAAIETKARTTRAQPTIGAAGFRCGGH